MSSIVFSLTSAIIVGLLALAAYGSTAVAIGFAIAAAALAQYLVKI
jgi:hypothetical protein